MLGAVRCRRRRCAVRLVLRPPVRHLPRDADARVRADRLVGRFPVGRDDRRLERPGRHLAAAWLGSRSAYYCADVCSCARWESRRSGACVARRSATRCAARAIRRCARKRSASTCARSNGPRSSLPASFAGLGRRAVRVLQGLDLARDPVGAALGRRAGHGAARRRAALTGPVWGAALFTWLQDVARARDRVLARRHRRRDPRAGIGYPTGHRRGIQTAAMSALAVSASVEGLRRRPGGARRLVRRRAPARLVAHHRPQRRRQDHLLQHASTASCAPDAGDIRLGGRQPGRVAAARASGGSASGAPSRSPRRSAR